MDAELLWEGLRDESKWPCPLAGLAEEGMNKPQCHVCQKAITPEQRRKGWFSGGKSIIRKGCVYIEVETKPKHSGCGLAGIVMEILK